MKTLPSETAQALASYLCDQEDEFLKYHPGCPDRGVNIPALTQVIQDYWDSLIEYN